MKGIVFTEFLDLVEKKFGLKVADEIITDSNLKSNGAYTAVGTYDHAEIIALVSKLSEKTSISVPELIKAFGGHLLEVFVLKYANFFDGQSTFDVLKQLDNHIHVEVKKLYPDADLPKFSFEQPHAHELILTYSSNKPFADLAEGLLNATIKHFKENISLATKDLGSGDGKSRQFRLIKN